MNEKLIKQTEEKIEEILNAGINVNNLGNLYRLVKIKYMTKEEENMRYNNYGEYNNYGRGGSYGRRGYDARYRGDEYIERMSDSYGRYEEGRNEYNRGGSYGAKEDSMKSLEYMLESVCGFMEMLERNADSQEERALIKKYAKKLSEM